MKKKKPNKKIKRNDPCPCGSGKKYKQCCLGKEIHRTIPSILEFATYSTDEKVKEIISEVPRNPTAIEEPLFWIDLGVAFGVVGDHKNALHAFKEAEKITPLKKIGKNENFYNIKANIAVTESTIGNTEKALAILQDIPDGMGRKSVITGNILQDLGSDEEAILHYEKAIAEEPDFYLPYVRLLRSLRKTGNPAIEYWLYRAINVIPENPLIALTFVDYCYKEKRFEDIAKANWLDEIQIENRGDIFGSVSDQENYQENCVFRVKLVRHIAQIVTHAGNRLDQKYLSTDDSEALQTARDHFSKALELIQSIDRSSNRRNIESGNPLISNYCDEAKFLTTAAANFGKPDAVNLTFPFICHTCQKERIGMIGPQSTYLAKAYLNVKDYKRAVQYAEESLRENPEDKSALWDYYWGLDELGKLQQSIETAEQYYRLDACHENDERIATNLGYLYSKQGSHGLAIKYLKIADKSYPSTYTKELLAFLFLLSAEFSEAQKYFDSYIEIQEEEYKNIFDGANDGIVINKFNMVKMSFKEFELEKTGVILQWNELKSFAEDTKGSPTYSLDIIAKNNSSEIVFAGDSKVSNFSIRDVFKTLGTTDKKHHAELQYFKSMMEREDFSNSALSIANDLPNWENLPEEAKITLIEAERRLNEPYSADRSQEITSFAKAVEIALKRLVFDQFSKLINSQLEIKKYIKIGLKDRQARSFILFIDRGYHLELGAMTHTLRLCRGKTADKVILLSKLKKFIEEQLKLFALLSDESINALDALSKVRNPASHSRLYGKNEAIKTRSIALILLGKII